MYLSEASKGNRSTRSHPFLYHGLNAYMDELKIAIYPRTIATWRRQLMGLSPKYNDLWFGQGHGLDACP